MKYKVSHYESDDYDAEFNFIKEGGDTYVFLHLDVHKVSKDVIKDIRKDLDVVLEQARNNGIETVDFALPEGSSTKFHNMIRPLDYEVRNEIVVGGWFTGVE